MNIVIYRFDDFELNTHSRSLFYQNTEINLSSRAYEILLYLIKKQGEVVEKDSILQEVWSDSFVEESNLAVQISALRRVLKEKNGMGNFIKTISGRGYCFVESVTEHPESENGVSPHISSLNEFNLGKNIKALDSPVSLSILPFSCKTKDSELEYLADGITKSLINNLSQLPNLKVMAFSAVEKFRQRDVDLQELGFLLGVDKILLGNISKFGDDFEISVELIYTPNNSHIWGSQYNFRQADIFQIRNDVSLKIAKKLRSHLTEAELFKLTKNPTSTPKAYDTFLKGKYILENQFVSLKTKESLLKAINLFQRSIRKDPNFALAYAEMAHAYIRAYNYFFMNRAKAIKKAKTAIQLAFNLDEHLPESYAADAIIKILAERNWRGAEESLKKAIDLNPNYSLAYQWLSILSTILGNSEDAITYQQQAIDLDPISFQFNSGLGTRLFIIKQYNKAIIQCQETIDLEPRMATPFFISALSYAHLGVFDEAIYYANKAFEMFDSQEMLCGLAYVYGLSGERVKAEAYLEKILARANQEITDFSEIASIYTALGEEKKVFEYLEKAIEGESVHISILKTDPRFDPIRDNPAFKSILKKLNLE